MPRIDLIELRGGTAADWAAANPVLGANEPGYATDTHVLKIGDGATAWNSLLPFAGGGGSVGSASLLSARYTWPAFAAGSITFNWADAALTVLASRGSQITAANGAAPSLAIADYLVLANGQFGGGLPAGGTLRYFNFYDNGTSGLDIAATSAHPDAGKIPAWGLAAVTAATDLALDVEHDAVADIAFTLTLSIVEV